MAHLQVKKMKQGMSYSCKEKTIILNVFKYFRIQLPEKCVTDIVRRTSKATGCSEKSIFQFRKEESSAEGFREPSKTKIRKNININSRDIKYDHNVRLAIRNIIYDLKYRSIIPSLNTILKQVNADNSLPNFSLMTLRRLMFDMGFYYEKSGNKSILTEKPIVNKDNVPAKCERREIKQSNGNCIVNNSPKSMETVISTQPLNNCEVPCSNLYSFMNHPPAERTMPVTFPFNHNANIMPLSHPATYHNTPVAMNMSTNIIPINHRSEVDVHGHYIKMERSSSWMIKQ